MRRGAGWYYHRGNGYYSKYSAKLDKKRGASHKPKSPVYAHTGDYSTLKKARIRTKKVKGVKLKYV